MNYFDTSALIQRFVVEEGSPRVNSLLMREGVAASAKIAYAEVYAGLSRKRREGHLSQTLYTLACRQFESDWPAYIQVELRDEVLALARELIQRHPLRAYDAIHLASALSLQTGLGEEVTFVVADDRLLRAAQAEQLKPLNPTRT